MTRVRSSVRQTVRQRANNRCEYCRKPDGISQYSHHVDHIISQKHGGSSELDNLAWSCFHCNAAKGSNLTSLDPISHTLTPLFNPRTDDWNTHFEVLITGELQGSTATGRATAFALRMNDNDQVQMRLELIKAELW